MKKLRINYKELFFKYLSAIYYIGNFKFKIRDYMIAIDFYQRAIDIDWNCKYAYNDFGIIYKNVKNDTKVLEFQ